MKRPWKVRDNLAARGLDALLWLIRICPLRFFPWLATALGGIAAMASRKERRRLRVNVHKVLGLPPGSHFARMFERQVFRHQIICALETLRAVEQPDLLAVRGLPELEGRIKEAEAAGRGHIVVTAHLGSWELCALFGQLCAQKTFHVLAKPSSSDAFNRFLEMRRARMGVDVFWTDRKGLLKDMLKALKAGESVGFVMDQKPERRQGPVVNFMGHSTEFVSGPAAVTSKTGCAVISIFCLREGPFRYRVVSDTLVPAGEGGEEQALTETMAKAIEDTIRTYPEQWTWNYKRWRFA